MVALAARGSEQNESLEPTRYSDSAPWVSNGYEEVNLRAFFQLAESRHKETHGTSVMDDVQVLALDASVYPAALHVPRIAEVGEDLDAAETLRRLANILRETPAWEIAWTAASGFAESIVSGTAAVSSVIDDYEATSGCQPQYVFVGYSQGSALLQARERDVAARTGRLLGAIYIGNPMLAPGDPSLVGDPRRGVGLLGLAPFNSRTASPLSTERRINYCLRDDFVCDAGPESATEAFRSGGGTHALYFLQPDEAAAQVADTFGQWVDAAR